MKLFMTFLGLYIFMYSPMIASEEFSEKMIVSVETDATLANEKLSELKIYFIENPTLRTFENKFHLYPALEKVGDYYMLVIKPVSNLESRNTLLLLLKTLYPHTLAINNHKIHIPHKSGVSQVIKNIKLDKNSIASKKDDIGSLWNTLELQWVTIWFLAVIGLLLSLWNRRKLSHLNDTQDDIRSNQKKIESEIKQLGTQDA